MPTTVTKTVGPGKDYASLALALAGEARNLVTADEICELVLYAFEDTTPVGIGGYTTDATRFISIRVNPADRHDGTRSPSAYRLHTNVDFSEAFNVGANYTRIQGLQVTNDPSNGTGILVAATNVRIIDTLVYDTGGNGIAGAVSHSVVMNNVAVMNCGGFGIGRVGALDGAQVCINCTSVSNGGVGFRGYTPFGNTSTFKNCYAGGNTGADFDNTDGITVVTCFSEDGSSGTTTAAYSINSGARFFNVTNGSEDVHHTGSSTLRHVGTDLGADPNWIHPDGQVDIDGEARDPDWDIGIDQAPPDAVTNESPPTISGYAFTGHTLTAVGGVWTDDDSTAGQWRRETGIGTDIYEDIPGATGLTFDITTAELGRRVLYMETATNMTGSTSYPSDPSDAVGTAVEIDALLTAHAIFGANLPRYTYELQPEDVGLRVTFMETATNDDGSTDHESAPYGPVGTGLEIASQFVVQMDLTVELPIDIGAAAASRAYPGRGTTLTADPIT